ncbi:MAG: ABC transporter permease [Methanobacteriota archaeon]|nr:MAG: ABC transporter permease [Euryarchaeota archaeon]
MVTPLIRYLIKRMNRELKRSKFRAIGSSALVLVAVAAYISFSAMVPSALTSLEKMVEEQNISDFTVHMTQGNLSYEAAVSGLAGVATVDHRVTVSSKIKYTDARGETQMVPATLVGIEPNRLPLVNTLVIRDGDGDYLDADRDDEVLIEGGFAYGEDIGPWDSVSILTSSGYAAFSVAGLAFSPEHIMMPINPQSVIPLPGSLAVVYMAIDSVRNAFEFPEDYINELLFLFDGIVLPEVAMSDIAEALSSATVTFTQQRDEIYGYALIKEDLKQGDSFTAVIAMLILLAAFFVTYSFFSRIVDEEKKQIGVLRALGYSRRSVLASYLYMAIAIGLGGSIVGVVIGIPAGEALSRFYVETMLHSRVVDLVINADAIILGLIFGPMTTGLACTIAVWGTVSLEPHEAIKDMRTQKVKRRRRSRSIRIGSFKRTSYMTLYTLRNTFRHKRRTTFTVVAVAFSIVLGAMSFLMVESFANSITKSIEDHENWDLVVDYSYPLERSEAESISVPGLEQAVLISKLAVVWEIDDATGQVVVTGLPANQTMHKYALIEGREAADAKEVMIGYTMSNDHGISSGDHIEFRTVDSSVVLSVSGILADTVGEVVVFMEVIEQLAERPAFAGMYVESSPGTADDVMDALELLPVVANVQMRGEVESGLVEFMQSYSSALYAFSLVGVTIATLTIANVVFMSVLERQYEYGQLRAIGYRKRDVSKSVLVEILAMIAIGGVVAIPLLIIVLESLVGLFREFWPTYSTVLFLNDWYGYLVVLGLTTAFGLLAAVPGIRFLGRIDIAKAVSGGRFG